MIAVADHIVEWGSARASTAAAWCFPGRSKGCCSEPRSLTAKYLRGELSIPIPAIAPQGHAAAHPAVRRDRAQPEEHRHRDPAEHADVRDRRERLRQVDAGARRALRRAQAREGRLGSQGRRAPAARRPRVRQRCRAGRSDADRPHAAIESGHLSQGVRSDPRAVCRHQGRASRAA